MKRDTRVGPNAPATTQTLRRHASLSVFVATIILYYLHKEKETEAVVLVRGQDSLEG